MGIMLESASERLCQKGMPHYGSPDKDPARRLQTLELAGQAAVPFTSGILIGIGETHMERIESLLALRSVHQRHGHLQEVIIQNFRAKPDTLMAQAPEPDPGRATVDDRRRPYHLRFRYEHSGATEPQSRRIAADCRCRH